CVENPTTIGSTTGAAGTGKAKLNAIKFTKGVDSATPTLFQALTMGAHFTTVKLYVRKAGITGYSYLTYVFSMVFVTNIDASSSTGDDPEEKVELAYGAMQVSYLPASANGVQDKAIAGTWNQVTNTSSLVVPGN